MPSLKALGEFKSSFNKIGKEEQTLRERQIPYDDLPLPDHEPQEQVPSVAEKDVFENNVTETSDFGADIFGPDSIPDIGAAETTPADTSPGGDFIDFLGLNELLGSTPKTPAASDDTPPASNDFSGGLDDLGSLLGDIPDDFSSDSVEPEEPAPEEASAGLPEDDFSAPSGLLDGLDDILAGDDGVTEESSSDTDFPMDDFLDNFATQDNETAGTEGPGFDLGDSGLDLGDAGLDLGDSGLDLGDSSFDSGDLPDSSDNAFDLGDIPDFNEQPGGESEIPEIPVDDFSASGFPADDFSVEDFSTDESPGTEEDSFSIPDFADSDSGDFDSTDFASADFPDFADSAEPADSMDSGADFGGFGSDEQFPGTDDSVLEGADLQEDIPLEDAKAPDQGFGSANIDEFAIPGMDDGFDSGPTSKADEPEEIRLTDDELATLKETLASYPLNLRIACQQIIVEEAVAPELMSKFIKLLSSGGSTREASSQAGKILGKKISIPKGFEKKSGEALEEEQSSFSYIFVHSFLPVFRAFAAIVLVAVSLGYLIWTFIIQPLRADAVYQRGYDQISVGGYGRARDLFREAFKIHQKKVWFYRYAEAFRDERQYLFAEEKYDELLAYTATKNKRYIPDKQAVLDYAAFETYYLRNYEKADRLLRHYLLDYSVLDKEGLLALGDNNLAWGDIEKERYEDAREAFATYMERYGRTDPVLERMLKYFIRTDNLGEVIQLQGYFMASEKRKIEASTLAELGGYLLDKRTEEIRGVPNEYLQYIGGIRDVLLRAIRGDTLNPEAYYHLSRYYNFYGNSNDEELTLSRAIQAFDVAKTETSKRLGYRIDALRRYAEIHTQRREFFYAEEYLIKGVRLYEDGLSRRVITASPTYGKLYADLGDLEYFVKDGNALAALDYYHRSELNGYAPPEIQYRMGASYYQLGRWPEALDRFAAASFPLPFNRKILYALGNVSYLRGNYFAAQGYYDRLLQILDSDRIRFPLIAPTNNEEQLELTERYMVVQNNLAVTLEALTLRTGDNSYRSRALGLYSESERAWDILTRNPDSMIRLRPSPDLAAPGINPAYINIHNSLYPIPEFDSQFFLRIDRDILEPSSWEKIAPQDYTLSEGISTGR
jgi:tetratricopeptide (TPR) repeat protein